MFRLENKKKYTYKRYFEINLAVLLTRIRIHQIFPDTINPDPHHYVVRAHYNTAITTPVICKTSLQFSKEIKMSNYFPIFEDKL